VSSRYFKISRIKKIHCSDDLKVLFIYEFMPFSSYFWSTLFMLFPVAAHDPIFTPLLYKTEMLEQKHVLGINSHLRAASRFSAKIVVFCP